MPDVPIMAVDTHGTTHRIGYDERGEAWTACGFKAGHMPAVLGYVPDCAACVAARRAAE